MRGKHVALKATGITGALVAVAVLMLVAFTGAVAQGDEDDQEVRQRSKEFLYILAQGESGRLSIEMEQGGGLNYVLSSGQRPVEFHMFRLAEDGQETSHMGPKRTTSESGTFVAPADGIYVWSTQREQEREATVRLTLNGEFGILEMEGMEQAREVPGVALLPWLVGVVAVVGSARRARSRV